MTTVKLGEVGKGIRYVADFDLSGFTVLNMKFTGPSGQTLTRAATAPTDPYFSEDLRRNVYGGQYAEYITNGAEFDEVGQWTVCIEYQDASPSTLFGDDAEFTVAEAC